jgi:alpha-tubulin suppressor-like RCC1 family protein
MGAYITVSIKTDGTLWAWGENANGALGQGDTTSRSSPVQVGSLSAWTNVAAGGFYHTSAIAYY